MKYICKEQSIDRETIFFFFRPDWATDWQYVDIHVQRISNKIGLHSVQVRIEGRQIMWHVYHLREQDPCITPKARSIIERTWKLKALL